MKKILLVCLAVATAATVNAQARFGIKAGAGWSGYEISVKGISPTADLGHKLGGYGGFVFNVPLGYQWGFQADLLYAYEGAALKVGKNFFSDIQESAYGQAIGLDLGDLVLNKNLAASINFHQIRLAPMLTFTPNDGITVMAGPYVSYRIGTNVRLNDNVKNIIADEDVDLDVTADEITDMAKKVVDRNMKKLDVGVSMGIEYAFCNGLFIDFRYNLGLMNLLESNLDITDVVSDAEKINLKDAYGVTPRVRYHTVQLGLGYRF